MHRSCWKLCLEAPLLFAVEVVEGVGADETAFRRAHEPFVAVGIVTRFPDRIVGDDQEVEGLVVRRAELMGFARLEQKGVAGGDGRFAVFVAHKTTSPGHMIEFPLGAVGMEGAEFLAGRNLGDLDIERMPFIEIGGIWLTPQGQGKSLEGSAEVPLG